LVADFEIEELVIIAQSPFNDSGLGKVFKDNGPPQWSSDGGKLAFSSIYQGNYAIFVINADGSDIQVIAQEAGQDFVFPYWLENQ